MKSESSMRFMKCSCKATTGQASIAGSHPTRWRTDSGFGRFLRRNPALVAGLTLLSLLFLFVVIGSYITDPKDAQPLAARPLLKPSADYPFGTDKLGRDLFATIVAGIPLTFAHWAFGGLIGLGIGTTLGFVSAYYGGWVDTIIRGIVDVGLTIPGLMVLLILAISFSGHLNINHMALIVGVLAWLYPARVIRSQVLTLKQRPFVEVARLTGMSGMEIIFLELMPNLLPYLAASLVGAICLCHPRLDWFGSLGAGSRGFADAGHDHLLGNSERRSHQPLVVVVGTADSRHFDSL